MGHAGHILELSERETSFLEVSAASDGTPLRCAVVTYGPELKEERNRLDIIFQDMKKRQKKTLDKAGVTAWQLRNGMERMEAAKQLSEYFIQNDGPLVGYEVRSAKRKLDKTIREHMFKPIGCACLDLGEMARECGIYQGKDMVKVFADCLGQYRRFQWMERNQFGCVVNYAYSMTVGYGKPKEMVYCDTTIGRIFYSLSDDTWFMSQKEMARTGHRIENFDIGNIKWQLRAKYGVHNMSELARKLQDTGNAFCRNEKDVPYGSNIA